MCVCLPWPPWHVGACQICSQLDSSAVILAHTRAGHSFFLEAANGTEGQVRSRGHETPFTDIGFSAGDRR